MKAAMAKSDCSCPAYRFMSGGGDLINSDSDDTYQVVNSYYEFFRIRGGTPLGTFTVLKGGRVGDDIDNPFDIVHYINGVVIKEPGIVVAVGGIPDELKIKDGISFSFPCPWPLTFKVPKNLPEENKYTLALVGVMNERIEKSMRDCLNQAFVKAVLGICEQSEEESHTPIPNIVQSFFKGLLERGPDSWMEANTDNVWRVEDEYNFWMEANDLIADTPADKRLTPTMIDDIVMQQLPRAMIEVNVAVPLVGSSKSVKCGDYAICNFENYIGRPSQCLRRNYPDGSFEIIHVKSVILDTPGFIAAVGGLPDELKIKGGISFSCPYPILKYPYALPQDPTERKMVADKVFKEAAVKYGCKNAFMQAYEKALMNWGSSSIAQQQWEEKEKPHDGDHEPPLPMLEINMDKPMGSMDPKIGDLEWVSQIIF